ncbi:MAG: hypothetical protein HYT80_05820 [Euryarchaeota archaeon]|nr:hypothetical protein [Euryarchaeota archaeon]
MVVGLLMASALVAPMAPAKIPVVPGEGALYLTNSFVSGTDTGTKIFKATDVAPSEAAVKKAYLAYGVVGTGATTRFSYTVAEPLTVTGPIRAEIWVSCDVAAVYGHGNTAGAELDSSRFWLFKGTTQIGLDERQDAATTCTGPTSIRQIDFETPPVEAEFKKGDVIHLDFLFFISNPPESAAKNVHFLLGSTVHMARVTAMGLPGGGAATPKAVPQLVEEALEGTNATIDHSFENATSDTYRFNWTTETTDFDVLATAKATNGTVHVTAKDGSGNETLNFTLPDATTGDNFTSTMVNTTAGTWVIELAYTDFQGTLDFSLTPYVPPAVGGNATGDGNATENATAASAPDEGGLPGLEIVGAATAIAVAVAVRRRRD